MNDIKMGSLFDGSAGFPLAAVMNGMQAVWASEIEPYPIRVTTKRLPFMKHYGDISQMNGAEIEPVDIITGGSPCQDMSVAGKRAGLDGERSGLFREQIRIIKEMREATNGQYPRYMVWENVPGALSSNKGADFRCVLEETARIKEPGFDVPMPEKNKWSTAGLIMGEGFSIGWRILDAQYWGVPQRRRRIFLVADFSGTSAGEILFKREGLSWHFAQSREAWQTATGSLTTGSNETGEFESLMIENHPNDSRVRIDESGTCQSLTGRMGTGGGNVPMTMQIRCGCEGGGKGALIQENKSATLSTHNNQTLFCMATQQGGAEIAENLSPTITAAAGMSGNNQPVLCVSRTHGISVSEGVVQTIQAAAGESGNNQPMICEPVPIQDQAISNGSGNGNGIAEPDDPMYTLMAETHHGVAYSFDSMSSNSMKSKNPYSGCRKVDIAKTLDCTDPNPSKNQGGIAIVEKAYSLQGNMIGRSDENGPQGSGVNEDVNFTLNATDQHGVCCMDDRKRACPIDEDGKAFSLVATDYKGCQKVCYPQLASGKESVGTLMANAGTKQWLGNQEAFSGDYTIIEQDYIVRRLMPIECARLQGFPDWWTANLGTKEEDITEEMMVFWREVFETHRKVITGASKPKTDKQIKKWLMNPDSDSAEYKMWGNGVALPCVLYVMEGIADELRKE